MICLFLGNLVFGSAVLDIRKHPSFLGVREEVVSSLVQVFGERSDFLQECLNTIKPGGVSIFVAWERITERYPVEWRLYSSQGRIQSSPLEFFYALCCLSLYREVNFFGFYNEIPKEKQLSASFLMILSVLSGNPHEALKTFQEIIHDMTPCEDEDGDEDEAVVRRFHAFSEACKTRFLSNSGVIKYMGDPEEDVDNLDDEQREQVSRKFLEALMRAHLRSMAAANAA